MSQLQFNKKHFTCWSYLAEAFAKEREDMCDQDEPAVSHFFLNDCLRNLQLWNAHVKTLNACFLYYCNKNATTHKTLKLSNKTARWPLRNQNSHSLGTNEIHYIVQIFSAQLLKKNLIETLTTKYWLWANMIQYHICNASIVKMVSWYFASMLRKE